MTDNSPTGDKIIIRTDDGIIKATVTSLQSGLERPNSGARLGGTLDVDEPCVHYVDYHHDN
jgi:hypothetical protein